jgi:hypothetical protein
MIHSPLTIFRRRPTHLVVWLAAAARIAAQDVTILKRGAHHNQVEVISTWLDEAGHTLTETNSYVQLETGLNFRNAKGEWEESKAEFAVIPGAVTAWQGQHKVSLAPNLNTAGAVQLRLPDGRLMPSHVFGLAYFDTKTGQSVLIAEVKDSDGVLVSPNELVYPDAFAEIGADVRYTYTRAGFEQDIILRERPPGPEAYGLDPATTRLEVWTEFEQPPEPQRMRRRTNALAAEEPDDEELDFGSVKIGSGRSFRLGREDESLCLVVKEWVIDDNSRRFLVEAVDVSAVAAGLEELPASKGGGAVSSPVGNRLQAIHSRPAKIRRTDREQVRIRRLDRNRDTQLLASLSRPGLVVDYLTLNTSQSNCTLASDETYFVTGAVILTGTTTFEGGTVVKLDSSAMAKLEVQGTLAWGGAPYRPVVFTAKDDNTVGEYIAGSTGNPTATYYGATGGALVMNNSSAVTLTHLRMSHQRRGLSFASGSGHTVRHAQFVRCTDAIWSNSSSMAYNVFNCLFNAVGSVLAGKDSTIAGQHLTVNVATSFNSDHTVTLNNSLLVQVTSLGSYANPNNSVNTAASGAGLFQTVTGGNHYLLAGSPYRNTGTSSIDSTLASELKAMTTEAPQVLTGTVSLDTTLAPRVARDTDKVDRGYHYLPLDYVLKQVATTVPLRLTNGVAVAVAGTHGVDLNSGGQFIGEGRAENLNRLTRWHNVQEQSVAEGNGGPMTSITGSYGSRPTLSLRFTDITALGRSGTTLLELGGSTAPFASVTLEFCQLRNVGFNFWPTDTSTETVTLRNNLFERSSVSVNHSSGSANTPLTFNAFNNLFWRGSLQTTYDLGTSNPGWTVKDNLFDGTTQTLTGTFTASVSRSNNGFTSGTANTYNGTDDQTGLSTNYQSKGAWGNRYYPATGTAPSLATLIDTGSRNRDVAGLFYFTVKTANSSKEGADPSAVVDIGNHYVGLNDAGTAPVDTDGDGIPDYVEDRDGDNDVDPGETNPAESNGVGAGTAALLVFTPLQ